MADEQQKDPLVSAFFTVEFGNVKGAFRECTGMSSENEVVEYKASGKQGQLVFKNIPGRAKWGKLTLKRGITDAMDMCDWREEVAAGKVQAARKNGSITLWDQDGKLQASWNVINAWPSKITGPTYNATSNEIAIEELEIVHEGSTRVKS